MAKKYVWLNISTGKFSNSWDSETMRNHEDSVKDSIPNKEWKLIEYECLNDEDFEFYNLMKVVTNR